MNRLSELTCGCVTIVDGDTSVRLGPPSADLHTELTIHHPRFYRRVAVGGGLGAAAALFDGDWSCDDLTALIRILIQDLHVADGLQQGIASPLAWLARLRNRLKANTLTQSRKNIQAHYDLGNEFFALFLDETMNYSSGIFLRPDATLREASEAKMRAACDALRLKPGDRLLEIGTGWGALAEFAATNYGCRVTSTTISREQYNYARRRIQQAGLTDRVNLLCQDYRQLEGKYDRIVSIEMIEAVGHEYFGEFFSTCRHLLKSDGAMLTQAIVIKDARFRQHIRSVDFIREYIFPGGCLPSIATLTETASSAGNLRLIQLVEFASHYAETLRRWRSNFCERLDRVRSLGFAEAFIRKWLYYLCYCEAAFEERQVNVVQMLMATPRCSIDVVSTNGALQPDLTAAAR